MFWIVPSNALESKPLTDQQSALLDQVTVGIANLSGAQLGAASGTSITIDTNAARYGWFVDGTPLAHEEFGSIGPDGLVALGESAASGRMDLLTVLLHELGHVLGHDDDHSEIDSDSLMYGSLNTGIRRLPS